MEEGRPLLDASASVNYQNESLIQRPKTPVEKVVSALSSLGDKRVKAGVFGSAAAITKLIVGAGSFVLPAVAAHVGFIGLSVSLLFLASLAFYTSFLVVGLKQKYAASEELSLAEFASRHAGRAAGVFCEICVLGASVGGCAVYLNFTGQILSNVYCSVPNYLYILGMGGVVLFFIILQAVLLVFLKWDPLLFLARTSMVGFAAAVAAAAATIILGAIDFGFLHPDNYPPLFVIENIPSAYGSIAFLFCVALFMFPVHSAIDKPRLFNRALIAGYSVAFIFNLVFSLLGVVVFGVGVNSIIVNSLPVSTAAKAIQILLSLDIFFTFLVVVVPSSGSVRKLLASISASLAFDADEPKRALSTVFVVALAPMLVLSCCLVLAIFVPGVQDLVGFVSALGLSFTALILPAILQLKLEKNGVISWIIHLAIIVFASVAGGYTLYNSIVGIIADYEGGAASGIFGAACNSTFA